MSQSEKQEPTLAVNHEQWDSVDDDCPECGSSNFESVDYDTTIYDGGKEVNDRWYKKGNLLTKCISCGEELKKHPAYDVLEEVETESTNES